MAGPPADDPDGGEDAPGAGPPDAPLDRSYPGGCGAGECGCGDAGEAGRQSIYTVDPRLLADERGRMDLERRDYAKILATVGGLTALASLAAPLSGLTRVFERTYTGPVYSDGVFLVDAEGERIGENFLSVGEFATVFPEPRPGIGRAPTLLVRFEEEQYGDATKMEFTVSGYAAYSKVCTHAGCMVADREDTTMVCPCHLGKFDPLRGARVTGGPPPRPLPQLPITLSSEGQLMATGDFEGTVGPGGE